jgi:hypothetical protein
MAPVQSNVFKAYNIFVLFPLIKTIIVCFAFYVSVYTLGVTRQWLLKQVQGATYANATIECFGSLYLKVYCNVSNLGSLYPS